MEPYWEYRFAEAIDEVTADLGVTKAAFASPNYSRMIASVC
jgi:hypothetical protein